MTVTVAVTPLVVAEQGDVVLVIRTQYVVVDVGETVMDAVDPEIEFVPIVDPVPH